jgi:plastocyanin
MHRLALLLAATVACAVTVAVGLTSAATTQTRTLKADAGGAFKFNKKTLTAAPGRVRIVMTNPSGSGKPHAIAIEGKGIDKDGAVASPGHTSSVTATLKRGTYEFYCPVDSHKAKGMRGTIKVS